MITIERFIRSAVLGCTIALGVVTSDAAAQDGATRFTIRVENVSSSRTLALSNGQTAPAPTAPVLWVVHTDGEPVFTSRLHDRGAGLESLAEEGDPSRLAKSLSGPSSIRAVGAVDTPLGDREAGPALPGKAYELTFTAAPGDRLSLAFMFGQSNDLFYAFGSRGIALFSRGKPISGDITQQLTLWDAGTEVNEEPGLGPNQAPRQPMANTGPSERVAIQSVARRKDGFTYPPTDRVVRVTITPQPITAASR